MFQIYLIRSNVILTCDQGVEFIFKGWHTTTLLIVSLSTYCAMSAQADEQFDFMGPRTALPRPPICVSTEHYSRRTLPVNTQAQRIPRFLASHARRPLW